MGDCFTKRPMMQPEAEPDKPECFFCGATDGIRIPYVGIALGMGGADYCFCGKCLDEHSADGFWKLFFKYNDKKYPPVLISTPAG